ncbi:multidrug resistance-associated protein [Penicillium cinerascens]|uniref:Multidrug resistance-associated protein n=1 Tax=Penicillium cinerascens TaxID=70096 RepID=A0A9W9M570_9EURO|nr:multidrug resistance-associated protein [Penicillium cinerascens]KAJ5190136.1 multidrug resistance-associated protein [Penicillium cinerascens]
MPSGCSVEAGNGFGPVMNPACRDGFDFTLLFEQAIFGLVPAVAFLMISPVRLQILAKRDVRIQFNILRSAKLITTLAFAAIQLALLISWAQNVTPHTNVSVASGAVNLAVAMEILILSWMEDERSVKPSSLLAIYLFLTLLFDIVQTRTLWLSRAGSVIPSLFTANVAAKTTMLLLESLGKQKYLTGTYRDLPPESTSGILNRSFMWWLNRLFHAGFRSLLTVGDLDVLDKPLESSGAAEKALRAWVERQRPARRFEFPVQMCRALKGSLALVVFPRLCLIGFTFAQPFLITSMLNWLDDPHAAMNDGYGLIGVTILIYLGMALSTLSYNHMLNRFTTIFRGATSSMIYDHALRIPDGTLEDRSATITLMTTDIDRIIACLVTLNECWARTIEVVIGISLLALRIGWVCLMPLIIVIISSVGSTYISKNIGGQQKVWVDAVQQRIAITRSMLGDLQTVKRMGLSHTFLHLIQNERVQETHQMAKYRWSVVWQNMIQNLPWALAPALTFAVYAGQGKELDVIKALSSLSVITLLTDPASKLLSAVPSTAAATGCFDRIQAFLMVPTGQLKPDTTSSTTEEAYIHTNDSSGELQPISLLNRGIADRIFPVISMERVNIRPVPSAKIVLRDISLQVTAGELVIIRGPVGSGKTTLLRAILGQAVCEKGVTTVKIQNPAFCAQIPWIPKGTIRDAICGVTSTGPLTTPTIDYEWYADVLHACALLPDLELFAEGDATQIGNGSGNQFSGGQMSRISLARAVYARRKLMLLDDVLSALDLKTKAVIMERLFGVDGLLRRTISTVVLVTHDIEHLSYADKVLVLSDGNLYREEAREETVYQALLPDAAADEGLEESPALTMKDKATEISKANDMNDLRRATGDSAVYRYYLRYIGWTKAMIFVFFVTINVFSSTYSQIWLEQWANRGGGHKPLYVTIYFILAICNTIGNGGYIWATPEFLATVETGSILNRFSQDMTLIESQLPIGVLITVSNLFSSIASAALIATGSKYVAISLPFLILAVFLLQHVYLKTSRQLRLLDLESKSPLYSHFLDTVDGLATIQAFGWEEDFQNKNSRLLDVTQRTYYMLNCIQRWLNLVLDLIVAAQAIIVVSLVVSLRQRTSVGLLGVSLNSILSFNGSLSSLISGWTQLEISLGSISRVRDFEMEVIREVTSGKTEPPSDWPAWGAIHVSGVNAQYHSKAIALKNFSLMASPGQRIGICGRTGSGKSSLLSAILGMLNITNGSILIDNVDLATLPPEMVRERLVTIPQDPFIMVGCTVRLNTDPTGKLPDADIIAALDRVGIWKGVLDDRGGLEAEITDTLSLSRGQQQLLEIARAILKIEASHAKILLIDEATSGVDMETDARVQALLEREPFHSCTVLTVAHRVHTLMDYDLVFVLDQGKVIETGRPRELAGQKDSAFSSLLNSQPR